MDFFLINCSFNRKRESLIESSRIKTSGLIIKEATKNQNFTSPTNKKEKYLPYSDQVKIIILIALFSF